MRVNAPFPHGLFLLSAVVCAMSIAAAPAAAQSYTVLHEFGLGSDGVEPYAGLIQGIDGNFYGTTQFGGAIGNGTVFKITPAGVLTTLHSFSVSDGLEPRAPLVQGTDENFYGTTYYGGVGDGSGGTVFKITPAGVLTTLHAFVWSDGAEPYAGLVEGIDGNFYGTTYYGGVSSGGTVFKITPAGVLTTLYSFAWSDRGNPVAGLVQGTDGNFYGTTQFGGASSYGTIFKITPAGALTTIFSFSGDDGTSPQALVQGTDENFYGTTSSGGVNGNGTVFKITTAGALTTLYSFAGSDGAEPRAPLVQGSDGNFYGTTYRGGASFNGTVFKITPTGTLTTLHSFSYSDGQGPHGGLVQGADGNFYGTTYSGGSFGGGVVFKLAVVASAVVSGGGTICSGGSATIQAALTGTPPWSLTWSDGVIQDGLIVSPATRTVSPTSSTTYTLESLSDANGPGTSSGSAVVSVEEPPTSRVSGDTTICTGSSTIIQAALTGAAPWSLVWSDGFTQTVSASPATRTVSPSSHTIYRVTSVSDAACSGTSSGNANVKVDSLPSADISAPASVCASSTKNTVTVPNAGGQATYSWAITNGTITKGAGTKKIEFTAGSSGPVSLTVTVTSAAGCTTVGTVDIPVVPGC